MSHKRSNFTANTIARRLDHCNGQCEGALDGGARCPTMVVKGRFAADHDLPDFMGGKNDLENCRILCDPCHTEKTKADQAKIGKLRRVAKADVRVKQDTDKPKMQSRGFEMSEKKSKAVPKIPVPRGNGFSGCFKVKPRHDPRRDRRGAARDQNCA